MYARTNNCVCIVQRKHDMSSQLLREKDALCAVASAAPDQSLAVDLLRALGVHAYFSHVCVANIEGAACRDSLQPSGV